MSGTIELKESPRMDASGSLTQYSDSLINPDKTKQANIVLKKLFNVVLLAAFFMIVEVIGGIAADSIAILSDAAHMLSDVLGFAISIISVWISTFPANERNSFGFSRAGVVGALASTALIWVLTGFLVYHAIVRLFNLEEVEINSNVMLATAIFGLATNLIMVKVLHSDEHGHSHHGHSHGPKRSQGDSCCSSSPPKNSGFSKAGQSNYQLYNDEEDKKTGNIGQHIYSPDQKASQRQENESRNNSENLEVASASTGETEKPHDYSFKDDSEDHRPMVQIGSKKEQVYQSHHGGHDACCSGDDLNLRAAAIHIMGDILQSIGVIIGAIIIQFSPDTFKIIDPLLTLVFALIVLFTTKRVLYDCLTVIMQRTPDIYYLSDMVDLFERIPHVVRVHNIHMWSLTLGKPILTAHVVVDGDASNVLAQVTQVCRKYRIFHSTIQIENQNEEARNLIDCNHNIC